MTSQFREYVTAVAFSLQLSKPMCDAMAFMMREFALREGKRGFFQVSDMPSMATIHSLQRRGLIEHVAEEGRMTWKITEAGLRVFDLLVMAGLCANINAERGIAVNG